MAKREWYVSSLALLITSSSSTAGFISNRENKVMLAAKSAAKAREIPRKVVSE
jgi:hypothetical protein